MRIARLTATSALLVVELLALVALPGRASAEAARPAAQADAASRAALLSERQRVRAELERANAEIDALKRSGRGLREDYRLRERLADAEALARRLTELDTRLGGPSTSAAPAARGPGAEPRVSSADGPAELDAKADILADQAQRLSARGDQLLGRARDLRARQTLRRRVGQMERDPFSPLEGSKRRAMAGSLSSGTTGLQTPKAASPTTGGTTTSQPAQTAVSTDVGTPAGAASQPAPAVGLSPGRAEGPSTSSQAAGALNTPPTTPTPGVAVSGPTSAPSPTSDASALSIQLRELLDPTTLAEIQHLEAAGGAGTSYEALERAGAALKARAERLRQQAASLRASEHPTPRAH
jgi:hypothetical protein